MATVVLSVVGSDRPGLTQALANAVLAAGGNWLESHLSRLGGLYVGSVLVEVAGGHDALALAVREVDAQGLEVRIAPATADSGAAAGEVTRFSLVAQDRPGIVHQVTKVLSSLGANIEDFDTRLSVEPHSGGALFHMDAQLRLPPGLSVGQVQDALEDMSAEIMVDITLGERRSGT